MTTVNPATPGPPSETSFDSLLERSVETEAAKQSKEQSKDPALEKVSSESTPLAKTPAPSSAKKGKGSVGKQPPVSVHLKSLLFCVLSCSQSNPLLECVCPLCLLLPCSRKEMKILAQYPLTCIWEGSIRRYRGIADCIVQLCILAADL